MKCTGEKWKWMVSKASVSWGGGGKNELLPPVLDASAMLLLIFHLLLATAIICVWSIAL